MSSHAVSDRLLESSVSAEAPRRRLNARESQAVLSLLDAGVKEVRETGYAGLTMRNVARRAGVAAATAYTYFASKDHLVAEIFWRRLTSLPAPAAVLDTERGDQAPPADRVGRALREVALLVSDEPELAAACTAALLGTDPDVRHLRDRIGLDIHQRISTALGPEVDQRIVNALDIVYSGAMLQAGVGHLRYIDLADRLSEIAGLILGDP